MNATEPPKLFISYSWSSQAHEEWVLGLATELRDNGIDVILDKWDLKEGHDAFAFMEQMVTNPSVRKVAMICDQAYAVKANERKGGVGAEAQIISPELYAKAAQDKFVAILPERDLNGSPFLPAYYKSRIYIDLSSPERYGQNFEQLLRWAWDKPLHKKPDLGQPPGFLVVDDVPRLPTAGHSRRVLGLLHQGRPEANAALGEYFGLFATSLERFRMGPAGSHRGDDVVENVANFTPYRAEILDVVSAAVRYAPSEPTWEALHRLFESMLPYYDRPANVNSWKDWDYDNFRFIVHEVFLYTIAILIKHERFDGVQYLLEQHYYVGKGWLQGDSAMVPYTEIRAPIRSLDARNQRDGGKRLSPHADLLEERHRSSGFQMQDLIQADLLLALRSLLHHSSGPGPGWWPVTLVYGTRQHGAFEVFARCQSRKYFARLKAALGIETVDDLKPAVEAIQQGALRQGGFADIFGSPLGMIGIEKWDTLP